MAYSKKQKTYAPPETTLLHKVSDPSRIGKAYTPDGKRYNVKTENTLFKARIKKKTYLDI